MTIIPIASAAPLNSNASGCGGCTTKSDAACTQHLAHAAKVIIQGFVNAGWIFDRQNPEHLSIVSDILAEDLRDDAGKPVAYDMPQAEPTRTNFLDAITEGVHRGLTPQP